MVIETEQEFKTWDTPLDFLKWVRDNTRDLKAAQRKVPGLRWGTGSLLETNYREFYGEGPSYHEACLLGVALLSACATPELIEEKMMPPREAWKAVGYYSPDDSWNMLKCPSPRCNRTLQPVTLVTHINDDHTDNKKSLITKLIHRLENEAKREAASAASLSAPGSSEYA
jgi:hypothetical protein